MNELGWRSGLDERERAAVHELATAAAASDGYEPLSEQVMRSVDHPVDHPGDAELLAWDGHRLAAVAHLAPPADGTGTGELVVHPDHRRAGLGGTLLRALLDRRPGEPLQLWAHGGHPGAAVLAERFGLSRVRELWQMRTELTEPPPEPVLADGVRIRRFRPGLDETEFLRVNNAAFDWHPEQGGWDLSRIEQREREPWFDPDGFLLAVDADEKLLGFHWTKVHPAEAAPLGEVYVLGIDPAAKGMGLGRALTDAGLRHLFDQGLRTVMLYVEADNDAAVRLYRGTGFATWHTDLLYAT